MTIAEGRLDTESALAAGLGDPVAYQARQRPQKLAMQGLASGETLTYAALDERVDAVAAGLGDVAGERIAVLGRNSIAQLVLGFAAARAGATFVPLNWRLTAPEVAGVLAACDPVLLFADVEFEELARAAVEGTTTRVVLFGDQAGPPPPTPPRKGEGSTPLILLCTSGTTGKPKGVMITVANAVASAINFAAVGGINEQTVALLDAPLFHTIGLIAVARTTIGKGGTLLVSDRFVPGATLARISDPALGVTHYFGVPQMAQAMLGDPGFAPADLSRLYAFFVGGAPPNPALIEAYMARGVKLINGYGMSEAGTVMHVPVDADAIRAHPSSVGLPAPLIEARIVGGNEADVAPGMTGEVWLRGPSVTRGYWNNREETERAFADGWFRTGDLGVRDADGYFRIVDRLKDMYVSGGENVYPAEVEAVLLTHPGVASAAVVGVRDERWGEVGLAFIVPRGAFDEAAVAAHCAARLARFKCPARYALTDDIPRTASGKIMKPALRERARHLENK